jgi:hypothetical protein
MKFDNRTDDAGLVRGEATQRLALPAWGGTRERHFDGTNLKPHKEPENAQTLTRRVHAVLGCIHGYGCDSRTQVRTLVCLFRLHLLAHQCSQFTYIRFWIFNPP